MRPSVGLDVVSKKVTVLTMTSTSSASIATRTWLVTGASSGIGLAIARTAARRGDNVVALARRPQNLETLTGDFGARVLARGADVTDRAQVDQAVAAAVAAFGRIDVVVNNAGYGLFGAVEEATDQQARSIFATNVHGLLNVLRATLPVLRAQRAGHILQGSSYYGQTAHPGMGMLAATKYAVEGLSDALAGELAPLGIQVTLLEPGHTATAFLNNLDVAPAIGDYDLTVREVQKALGELPPSAFNSAERVAAAVLTAVDAETPPRRLATGAHAMREMRAALIARLAELDAWAPISESVDEPDAA